MPCCFTCKPACVIALGLIAGLAVVGGAIAQPAKNTQPATPPAKDKAPAMPGDMQLPPGWTEADMQACVEAGTPGPMHQFLAEGVGTWTGKVKHWMAPGTEPMTSECTSTITSMMDGRFVRCEIAGDMPGMGPFSGFGIYGFDNVSKKFQSTWVDNCGTGMMVGTGDLSTDAKTLSWSFNYHCPVTKKPVVMREIERRTGKDSHTLEMFGPDIKTGKEFKMMEIHFTRQAATATAPAAH